jgi:hypothetical protein
MLIASFGFVSSCTTNPPPDNPPNNPPDAREELVRSLKGADVNGYLFATKEESNQITTTLTNGALHQPVKLDSTKPFVIGYASVKDKKTNAVKTIKAEIVKSGSGTSLLVTDLGTNGPLVNQIFEPRSSCPTPGLPVFPNLDACFDDFECKIRPNLLCEANKDCKIRVIDLACCTPNGEFHALIIVKPTKLRCLVAFPFDIDTVTLSQ